MLENVKGSLRVYAKEVKNNRVIYNTCIGFSNLGTDKNPEYIHAYVPVNFATSLLAKGKQLCEDGEYVDMVVSDAWFKAYKDKQGYTHPYLFINKAKCIKPETEGKQKPIKAKKQELEETDDLPF